MRRLALNPLSARETFASPKLASASTRLPEPLGALIAAKAEGNALFAEEIVSFLVERGVVKHDAAGVTFDPAAVTAALPQSVHAILAARIDQVPREGRDLLQTAAVIGRRFDPHLVLALTEVRSGEGSSFAALEAADLIHRDELSGDYLFKHILVREAIYDQLLSAGRAAMHLKVAVELEEAERQRAVRESRVARPSFRRRRGCVESVQISGDGRPQEPQCLRRRGGRELFSPGVGDSRPNPSCADPQLASPVVVGLLETLMLKGDYRDAGAIAAKYMPVVKQAGETPELVTAYYYQTLSLVQRYELRAAHALMSEAFEVAERIGDGRSRAYARAGLMHCRTRLGLDTLEEAERGKPS